MRSVKKKDFDRIVFGFCKQIRKHEAYKERREKKSHQLIL